jgi:hypothetical protein
MGLLYKRAAEVRSVSSPSPKPYFNVRHAPPKPRSEALEGIRLSRPSREESAALGAAASDWQGRARAYATPITAEAWWRPVGHAMTHEVRAIAGGLRGRG